VRRAPVLRRLMGKKTQRARQAVHEEARQTDWATDWLAAPARLPRGACSAAWRAGAPRERGSSYEGKVKPEFLKRERSILQRLRAASPGRHFVLCMVSGAQMAAAAQSLP